MEGGGGASRSWSRKWAVFVQAPKETMDGLEPSVQNYLLSWLDSRLTTVEEGIEAGIDDLVFPASTLNPPGVVGAGTLSEPATRAEINWRWRWT